MAIEELGDYLNEKGVHKGNNELMILGNGPTRDMGLMIAKGGGIDVWGVNNVGDENDVNLIFNIHGDHVIQGRFEDGLPGCVKYQDMTKPVILQREWDVYPTSVRYPITEMVQHFKSTYTANTIPYMIWLGWWMGYEVLHFYGVDYWNALRSESMYERPCTEYWMGKFEQAGGRVVVPPESHLLTGFHNPRQMYGYEVNPQLSMTERTRNWTV